MESPGTERHSSEHLPLYLLPEIFPARGVLQALLHGHTACLWMDSTGKHGHSSEEFVLGC